MPSTTAYKFGDVVLVPFPFTDQTATKKRPAVVVSSDVYHRQRIDVVVMAVTSQPPRSAGGVGEVLISGWEKAGLPKPSVIKPVLATVERDLILRKLGELQEDDRRDLREGTRIPVELILRKLSEGAREEDLARRVSAAHAGG
jgi:mRNA interferase MazF